MRAAFAFNGASFKPNTGKWLIVSHVTLICLAFIVGFLMAMRGIENAQTMSALEQLFVFLASAFLSYALLAFFVTPIGWVTLIYCEQNNSAKQKSAS